MIAADYLAQCKQYRDGAKAATDPGITTRLRNLAHNCLLLASDPTAEHVQRQYVKNCRDFEEYSTKTGRWAPSGDAEEIADVMRARAAHRESVG
jgi:hypothetical protein